METIWRSECLDAKKLHWLEDGGKSEEESNVVAKRAPSTDETATMTLETAPETLRAAKKSNIKGVHQGTDLDKHLATARPSV